MKPKLQHACFNCRKSWKKEIPDVFWETYTEKEELQVKYPCPECGKTLNVMGKNFRAPKKEKIKEWKVVEKLFRNGFRFMENGHRKSPDLPTKISEIKDFLKENPNHSLKVKGDNKAVL